VRKTPPASSAGTSRDQQAAATMMPPAIPIIRSIRRRGTLRMNSTGKVPIAVSAQVPRPPRNASATGGQSASGESRNPKLIVGVKSPS
jgi:hypothetical protein